MLINHYAGSPAHGMEFRPYYLARQWVAAGNEVVIVAADYSHLRKINPTVGSDFEEQVLGGVRYLFIKTPRYHGNGAARAANMAAFCFKLRRRAKAFAKKYRPQAVIASSTYPFDSYPAKKIADAAGAGFFFEIHDLWPLTQIELYGMKTANPYVRLLQRAEDFSFRSARRVISILPNADLHLMERGIAREKFTYIPNGVPAPEQNAAVIGKTAQKIKEIKESGRFVVLYVGGFATANAMEDFVGAAALVDPRAVLVLVGDGPKKPELEKKAGGAPNIFFFGGVPKKEVDGVLSLADCLYLGAKKCALYRYGMGMNKLYDYMLAAKPVICGIDASNDEITQAACGLKIEPQSPRAIADAVRSLLAMSGAQRGEMGRRGREYVLKNHNYEHLATRYLDALSSGQPQAPSRTDGQL